MQHFKQIRLAALLAGIAIAWTAAVDAGHGKHFDQTGCVCCPVCDHCCELKAEQVKEEKTCFEVESKLICIPRVVFPWQKKSKVSRHASCDSCGGSGCNACVHNGARVRRVCVLKTEKYECPACSYSWSPKAKTACDRHGDLVTAPEIEPGPLNLPVPTEANQTADRRSLDLLGVFPKR